MFCQAQLDIKAEKVKKGFIVCSVGYIWCNSLQQIIFHYDNARPHIASISREKIRKLN